MRALIRMGGLLFFVVRFLVLAVVLVTAWWAVVPYYGMFLAQSAGMLVHYLFGVTVLGVGVRLDPTAVLNTGTNIVFQLPSPHKPYVQLEMPVALLVTNLAPYAALVLASAGLTLRRRVRVLLAGCAIIVAGHISFVAILLRFQEGLKAHNEIATSAIQLFLVMPVILWIWLVYSERIAEYLEEADKTEAARRGKKGE